MFKVQVTVTQKNNFIPIWDKVQMNLEGEITDLLNLQSQLNLVKSDINSDLNRKNIPFKEVEIKIVFLHDVEGIVMTGNHNSKLF